MHKLISNKSALNHGHVLVVTTNDKERRAVLESLSAFRKMDCEYPNCRGYIGHLNRRLVVVLDGDGGFSGENAATSYAFQYISDSNKPKPALVVLCGVCWGNPKRVNAGDVLVATTVISINRSTVSESSINPNPRYFTSTLQLPKFQSEIDGLKLNATVLTLEQLIESEGARDKYLEDFPAADGGEMEAFALVPVCNRKEIPWVIIKGISDFATQNFDRESQSTAAQQASKVLGELTLAQILDPMETATDSDSIQRLELVYELVGNEICLKLTELDQNNIKVSIQKHFQHVRSCINYYTSAVAIHEDISTHMSQTLLELALNAFLHGGAEIVRVRLDFDKIDYVDNGKEFDIETLDTIENRRGGALTWQRLKRYQMTPSHITFESLGSHKQWINRYCFKMPRASEAAFNVRTNCKAYLDIYAPRGSQQPVIFAHDSCDVIYIDLTPIEMISVALDICDELRPLLIAGKHLQILTPNVDLADNIMSTFASEVASGLIELLPYVNRVAEPSSISKPNEDLSNPYGF